jgi:hypothetical protein
VIHARPKHSANEKETQVASIAQWGGRPKTAVLLVSRVARVHLALGVKIVHWVMHETEPITMLHNVVTVKRVKQHWFQVPLNAMLVTLVRLAATKVFAEHVRLGSIKIPKVKRNAVLLASRLEKYPTTTVPGVNIHHGVPAKWANI